MYFSQLKSLFYAKFRESSSNSAFSETRVKQWINEGYRYFINYALWDFLIDEFSNTNVFTNCSDGGASTGISLYVDSVDGMQPGMILWIADGTSFERVEIDSIDGALNKVALKSPGLAQEYGDGDTVSSTLLFLPHNCRKLLEIQVMSPGNSPGSGMVLKYCDSREMNILSPYGKIPAKPTHYARGGVNFSSEGTSTNFLTEEGVQSDSISCLSFNGSSDNYYLGWKFINITREVTSHVISYDSGTKTLTIHPEIPGMETGEKFCLVRDLSQVFLHPIPDTQYTFLFRFYRNCNDLTQDMDVPLMGPAGENHHDMLVDYALAEAYLVDKNIDMANLFRQKFFNRLEGLKIGMAMEPDHLINFRPLGDKNLPGFYL